MKRRNILAIAVMVGALGTSQIVNGHGTCTDGTHRYQVYDGTHDRDNDGIGCENLPPPSPKPQPPAPAHQPPVNDVQPMEEADASNETELTQPAGDVSAHASFTEVTASHPDGAVVRGGTYSDAPIVGGIMPGTYRPVAEVIEADTGTWYRIAYESGAWGVVHESAVVVRQ